MKHQCTLWRMMLLLGIVLFLTSSCAPPSLEVFLSPNPSFEQSSTSQTTSGQQQSAFIQPLSPAGQIVVQPSVAQSSATVYTSVQPAGVQTFAGQSGDARLVLQLNETMRETEALILSGEARLHEQNPLEAIREFERARLLLEQDFGPTLQHIEQQSTIQGGVGILSISEIQRLRNQQATLSMRINQAYDFEALYKKKYAEEKFEALRRTNITKTQPISVTGIPSSARVLLQPRPIIPSTMTPAASWFNVSWIPAEDIDRAIEQFRARAADFRSCLAQANQHFPQVTSILSQEGVPREMAYIALVESGYQPSARSSSGTAGLWQLSKSVARSYGLNVSSSSDERLSVASSTRAFARYVRDLQQRFGSWELAILGYHLGEDALRGAVSYTGSSDPQVIVEYSSSARAYLSKFAASMIIANNPYAYGFDGALSNISGQYVHQTGGQYSGNASASMLEPPVGTLY